MEDCYKFGIGIVAIVSVTILQLYAWATGNDGVVFATTSAILGIVVGNFLDVNKIIGVFKKND